MRLHEVSRSWQDGQVRLTGLITRSGSEEPFAMYFAYPEEYSDWVVERADAFAIAMLVPAMYWHEDLEITPPISPRLVRVLPECRGAFLTWRKELSRSTLRLTAAEPGAPSRIPRTASFFSGGVDSMHTALRRHQHEPFPDPLTHLLFMRGIETPLAESRGVEVRQRRVESIARQAGLQCLAGETNLRSFFGRHWERFYVGSGLAATAVSLGGGFTTVCIPSSSTYESRYRGGSNFITDPMFSPEYLTIWYDGADTCRAQKVRSIVAWDSALVREHLRVCIHNDGGDWNCGTCYKCVRTAIILELLSLPGYQALFREPPSAHWRRVLPEDHVTYTREALQLARELGTRPELVRMLGGIVNRRARFDATVDFIKHSPLVHALPVFTWIRDRLGIAPRER